MERNNYEVMRDLQGFFKPGERAKIYEAADTLRDKVLVRLLWKTGRRIGEILMVKVRDIDFDNLAIVWHIEKKTKKVNGERVKFDLRKRKPIDTTTGTLLQYYVEAMELRHYEFLFKSPYNSEKAISRQRAYQIIERLCERCGIENVGSKKPHPHHFRHTFAIELARKLKTPADVRKLQMIMEHSNLGVTEQYLQFSDEELRELMED